MHGTFVWTELATTNLERAKVFYGNMFGWSYLPFSLADGEYYLAMLNNRVVAGLGGMEAGAVPGVEASYWLSFMEVDDIDERVAKAREQGAKVLREPADIPNAGRVAVVTDPTGAPVGWMQRSQAARDAMSSPGNA